MGVELPTNFWIRSKVFEETILGLESNLECTVFWVCSVLVTVVFEERGEGFYAGIDTPNPGNPALLAMKKG